MELKVWLPPDGGLHSQPVDNQATMGHPVDPKVQFRALGLMWDENSKCACSSRSYSWTRKRNSWFSVGLFVGHSKMPNFIATWSLHWNLESHFCCFLESWAQLHWRCCSKMVSRKAKHVSKQCSILQKRYLMAPLMLLWNKSAQGTLKMKAKGSEAEHRFYNAVIYVSLQSVPKCCPVILISWCCTGVFPATRETRSDRENGDSKSG